MTEDWIDNFWLKQCIYHPVLMFLFLGGLFSRGTEEGKARLMIACCLACMLLSRVKGYYFGYTKGKMWQLSGSLLANHHRKRPTCKNNLPSPNVERNFNVHMF